MEDLNFVDKSDFMFHRISGKVMFKDDYYEIINESNLDFIWGNYYAFLNEISILNQYEKLERKSFNKNGFFAFSYNADNKNQPLINTFKEKGFETEFALGMTRTESLVEIKSENLDFGIVNTEADWQQVVDNQLVTSGTSTEDSAFLEKRLVDYRKMINGGLGHWFYAKKDDCIVGDIGIFFDADNARFQQVETIEGARGLGVCTSLVSFAGNYCLNKLRMKKLMIVAEEGSIASSIYQKLGFHTQMYTHSFLKLNEDNS